METYSYLALGDSYTVGESLPSHLSFPAQLVDELANDQKRICTKLKIIAKTGWTTNELQKGILRAKPTSDYDLVSLLIGVNNQYRSYPKEQYQTEFQILLKQAIGFAGGKREHVFVVAIPDYGCTPFGSELADRIFKELNWYNSEAGEQCKMAQIPFVDIFPISRQALTETDLLAEDKLHPSGKMYALWVKEIAPIAVKILSS